MAEWVRGCVCVCADMRPCLSLCECVCVSVFLRASFPSAYLRARVLVCVQACVIPQGHDDTVYHNRVSSSSLHSYSPSTARAWSKFHSKWVPAFRVHSV